MRLTNELFLSLLCFVFIKLSGSDQDAIDALEGHPNVKRVTSHKMVTRTLKYVPLGETDETENVVGDSDDRLSKVEQEHSIHRRSLSLVS